MNPKEFPWSEDQQVTVRNPTADAYQFKVHNKQYELGAGKTAKMPGYIAWVFVYGLATQLCQADNEFTSWNEEGVREKYYNRLFVGADDIVQAVEEVSEPEIETFDEEDIANEFDDVDGSDGSASEEQPVVAAKSSKTKASRGNTQRA